MRLDAKRVEALCLEAQPELAEEVRRARASELALSGLAREAGELIHQLARQRDELEAYVRDVLALGLGAHPELARRGRVLVGQEEVPPCA